MSVTSPKNIPPLLFLTVCVSQQTPFTQNKSLSLGNTAVKGCYQRILLEAGVTHSDMNRVLSSLWFKQEEKQPSLLLHLAVTCFFFFRQFGS